MAKVEFVRVNGVLYSKNGHGLVVPRLDGSISKCGGQHMCSKCKEEFIQAIQFENDYPVVCSVCNERSMTPYHQVEGKLLCTDCLLEKYKKQAELWKNALLSLDSHAWTGQANGCMYCNNIRSIVHDALKAGEGKDGKT